jgi:hypothetical protein
MLTLAVSYLKRRLHYVSLDKLREVKAGKGLQTLFWNCALDSTFDAAVYCSRHKPIGCVRLRFLHCLIPTRDRFLFQHPSKSPAVQIKSTLPRISARFNAGRNR